ncbi:MAG: formate C-acetyltransferase/glycerol dehydratase family glycyl radical enzyme [Solobacterium sp.]|nr:formate C-acetyltransferase/glycerol dehydratase family glycyl radical enzyme [Solobacterium sp.]
MKDFLYFKPTDPVVDWDRLARFQHYMQERKASICSERALLYTESFQTTEGEPYILRKAKAFAHTLEHMSLYAEDDSLIFGNQASRNFAAPIFPEFSIQWVIDELDEFAKREGDVFEIDEKTKEDLRSIAPYWLGHTHQDAVDGAITEELRLAEKQGVIHRGGISMSGDGHIVPDHPMILERGLRDIAEEAKRKMNDDSFDQDQKDFYEAVYISMNGVLTYIHRYGPLLREKAETTEDPVRKTELLAMAEMADTLMEQGARSFHEGCETVYLIHILQMIESNGHSFCYGRFDQYMYELYRKDIESGVLTKDKALEILTHMYIMNSGNNKVRPYGHTRYSQGYPLYSNLVVGGMKPDGTDGTNDLTYLCIEAMNLTSLAEPNFSARYWKGSPQEYLQACAMLIRTGCGMPSMFNDEPAVKGLIDLGIPEEDARDYCPIGCVETGVPGKYGHRTTGMTYVNWGKVFELMLYNGYDPRTDIRLISVNDNENRESEYQNYDELWNTWKRFLKYYSDLSVECDEICDTYLEIYDADPFASALIQDSMKLGKTLKAGGCRYDVISQSNIGPSVVGNSMAAIRQLVFDEKKITFHELMGALRDNWQSLPSLRIRKLVRAVPKFGNDEDMVDEIVRDIFNSYLELLPGYETLRKGKGPQVSCYTMSTSNITSYVPNGFVVGATPDGREAGSPLNEGCSPTQGTDRSGPTAVINSVAKLPNEKVAAGQLLNIRFTLQALSGAENLGKFVSFLVASQKKGIYHNQFNVISSEVLRKAQKDPDHYSDLIVRVAGYCAQFISLMPATQEAIIARTENEW